MFGKGMPFSNDFKSILIEMENHMLPAMSKDRIQILTENLMNSKVYLEFGMGGSTVLATRVGVPYIFSVDSSLEWLGNITKEVSKISNRSKIKLLHSDLGRIGDWGHPIGQEKISNWPTYYSGPWQVIQTSGISPDLVLIDGRFRVACFLYSILNLNPGSTIIWDDYLPRPEYHIIESILRPHQYVDSMAIFKITEPIDYKKALAMLFENLYNQD